MPVGIAAGVIGRKKTTTKIGAVDPGNPWRPPQQRQRWSHINQPGQGHWQWQDDSSGWRQESTGGRWVQSWHWQPTGTEAAEASAELPPTPPSPTSEEPEVVNPYRPSDDQQTLLRRPSDIRPSFGPAFRPPTANASEAEVTHAISPGRNCKCSVEVFGN